MWFLSGHDARMVLLTVADAFAVGLVFAWFRLAAASIWPCVIAHGFYDYTEIIKSGGFDASMRYSTHEACSARCSRSCCSPGLGA
jgi:membrane protease YdiL (CAAX protease family)